MAVYSIPVGTNPATPIALAGPGDKIIFEAGIHDDFATVISCSGNSTVPVEVVGEPGTAIRHPDGRTGTGYALQITGSYLYVHDLICEEAAKVVVVDGASHVKLQRIEGRNSGDEAFKIRFASSYIYVEDCTAHDTGLDSTFGEGFYVGSASSNWPSDSEPDLTHHIRLDNCYSYRCSTDGFDAKEGASDIVVKNHVVDHTLGNSPTAGAANGDSGYYSRADRIQFINCTVTTSSGISQYGFKCYDVTVGASTYGREQHVKGGSSTGHALGGVGSQSDAPNGMHVYSDFTASAPRIDEVGGGWDPDYSNLNPATFTEYSWSSTASAYGVSSATGPISPSFVSAGSFAATATSPIAPSLPSGLVEGDVVLAAVFAVDTDGSASTITTPSGWTLENTGTLTAAGGQGRLSVFSRVVPSGGITTPSFSCTGADGMYAACSRWSGVDPTTPMADATPAFTTGNSTTATANGLTTLIPGVMVVHFYAYADNWNMINPTNGATLAFGSSGYESITGTDGSLGCAYKLMPAAGPSGNTSVTATQSPSQPLTNYLAATVALRPAVPAQPGAFLPFF